MALAGGALLVGSCEPVETVAPNGTADPVAFKTIYSLPDCPGVSPGQRPANIGVINIVVPNNFNDNTIARLVNSKKVSDFPADDPNPEPSGNKGNGAQPGSEEQPFDFYTTTDTDFGSGDTGLILVRVIVLNGPGNSPNNSKWEFVEEGDFHGIGLIDPNDNTVACGKFPVIPGDSNPPNPPQEARQIATFYIDAGKYDWTTPDYALPFVIGLKIPEYGETPILIDPKIRNDGGGRIIVPIAPMSDVIDSQVDQNTQ
ncbi:MAG TPA: hypothetical protein VLA37_00105 [Sphingomonadaceae bacterium]|nr:hypothetical protein [Sphingomonadaceae bacterium]